MIQINSTKQFKQTAEYNDDKSLPYILKLINKTYSI